MQFSLTQTSASEIHIRKRVEGHLESALSVIEQLKLESHLSFIEGVAKLLATTFIRGGKVIVAGNGGSLCDAAHFAEELTGFFCAKRQALPAIVLSEPGHITCTANDMGYEWIFSRGVEAHGKHGDVFIGLTTSGNSASILRAFEKAKEMGLSTVSFLGKDGGKAKGVADHELLITGCTTSDRAQEAHMCAMHIIIDLVEMHLFQT